MLHRLIGEDIVLETNLSPDEGRIKADRGQIEQVVMNLVVNARDAMPLGGKLTIETQNVDITSDRKELDDLKPGPYVTVTVIDTGIGMDKETQSRIFEPFFTTKEAGRGTGLGLSTVYGIVRQSGGGISLDSKVGKGTAFRIYFPSRSESIQQIEEKFISPGELQGTETILLTEDDEMVRAMASRFLSTLGYRVLLASNGKKALAICEQYAEPIQLLITDVVMPEMGGPDLVEHLATLRPEIRILIMSGYADKANVRQQVLDDETPFIQKPFAPQDLARKVREILNKPH